MTDIRMSHHHSLPSQPYPSPYPPPSHATHPPPHPSHLSHPSHSSHPQLQQPPPAYPSHHRHANGPPGLAPSSGPGQPDVGPPPVHSMGNGHAPPGNHVSLGHRGHGSVSAASGSGGGSSAVRLAREKMDGVLANLASANENTWMLIGAVAEQMHEQDRAVHAFEQALRHNPTSILALNAVASIARMRDDFDKAIEYFQRILNIKQDNGEAWGSMGHCLLMKDDLPKAYTAYQQALYHLQNPKEPKLWYGIGILYDRYGSFDHAEEAFSSVLKMDPNFDKANEIYFRLGIIYKHQRKYQASLDCFKYILNNPPRPLTSWDIWFQLGHVYEQDRDFDNARDAYMRVLTHQPDHAKVLQQLGWLHHQPGASFADQEQAVNYLTKSLETDGSDAQSWYLLGRAFMAGQRYNKAYEAYQQAVYRDGRNPTFWCSIGVLYYQINQYRDALDAYSRAIRLNPYISEVWYNLGSLYESCNNQISDAIDAYSRAADLDPTNATIKQRLDMLQNAGNAPLPPAPGPVDVHPSQYTAQPQGPYPPGTSPGASPRAHQPPALDALPGQQSENGRALAPPPPGTELGRTHSSGPFRGGAAPPPLQHVDESRGSMSRHAPLAPMETERPGNGIHRGLDGPDRRHAASPASPGRRQVAGQGGQFPQPTERDEWERRERDRATGRTGPSPRMPDRKPSPRDRAQADYAYGSQGRYDEQLPPPANGNAYGSGHGRNASISREDPRTTTTAPSPSLSVMSAASGSKRKNRSVSKRGSVGEKKRKGTGSPSSAKGKEGEGSEMGSERGSVKPDRAVDEDYDEGGALDALMTLHGDRPQASPSKESGPSGASPTQPTGSKRPAPVSPTISPSTTTKKPRGDATGPSPSPKPASAPTKRTVIEVLNAERIGSPAIRPGSSLSVEGGRVGSGAPGGSPLPRVDDIDKAAPTPVASDVKASEPNSEQAAAAPGASDAKEQSEKSEVESSVVEPIPGAGTEESTDSTDQPAVDETKTAPEIRDESRPATPPLPPPEQVNGDGDVEMGKEAESNNNEQKEAAPQPATEEKPGEAQGESGGDEMDVDGSESAEGKTSKVNGEAPADTIETEDSKASAEDAVEEAPEAAELAA